MIEETDYEAILINKIPDPDKDGWIEAGVEEIASMMAIYGSLLTRTRVKNDRLVTEYLLPIRAPAQLK